MRGLKDFDLVESTAAIPGAIRLSEHFLHVGRRRF